MTDSILVYVAPHLQILKCQIASVEHAIAIAIQFRQRLETILCFLTVRQNGINAKQLRSVVDQSVAVFVQHQETVVPFNPARRGFDAICIMIKTHSIRCSNSFNSVTVEINS